MPAPFKTPAASHHLFNELVDVLSLQYCIADPQWLLRSHKDQL